MCNPSPARLSAAALTPENPRKGRRKRRGRDGAGGEEAGRRRDRKAVRDPRRAPRSAGRRHLLVEEHAGAHDELEDVLQGLHGLVQLLADARLLGAVHVVPQHLRQLPSHSGDRTAQARGRGR